jgi:hypothetical protein
VADVGGNFDEILNDDLAFVQLWHGLVALTDVVANGGADLRPVIRSHGGGGARLDTFESEGFKTSLAIAIGLDESLDIIARGGVVTGFDLGLEVGGEAFWEGDREGVHGV